MSNEARDILSSPPPRNIYQWKPSKGALKAYVFLELTFGGAKSGLMVLVMGQPLLLDILSGSAAVSEILDWV